MPDLRAALQRLVETIQDHEPACPDALVIARAVADARRALATPPPAGDRAVAERVVQEWVAATRKIDDWSDPLIDAIAAALQAARAEERGRCLRIAQQCIEPVSGATDTGTLWRRATAQTIAIAIGEDD